MNGRASSASPKTLQIIEAALTILRDEGERGLSMRGVAGRVGVSLSNVQYYFRGKDALIRAVVDHYVAQCSRELADATARTPERPLADRRRTLLRDTLRHGHEMTDMCRIFRELWSVAGRDASVEAALDAYYRQTAETLAAALLAPDAPDALKERVVLLVLPYVEGYSVTGRALAQGPDAAGDLLLSLLEDLAPA